MAVIEDGTSAGQLLAVDNTMRAARISERPQEALAWYSIGARSGALTAAAAAGAVFSLRNSGTNLIIVRRVGVGFVCTTAFTAAQAMDFSLIVARAFTASDTGGTAITLTGNNAKHRTSLGTLTGGDLRIATTAALTAGTKALDGNTTGSLGFFVAGVGTSLPYAPGNLFSHDTGDYPIVLAANEGINIQNLTLMGAAGVGTLYVGLEFAEVTAY